MGNEPLTPEKQRIRFEKQLIGFLSVIFGLMFFAGTGNFASPEMIPVVTDSLGKGDLKTDTLKSFPSVAVKFNRTKVKVSRERGKVIFQTIPPKKTQFFVILTYAKN